MPAGASAKSRAPRVVRSLDGLQPPREGTAVTVGTFDGVHLGHRRLIDRTIAEARRRGLRSAAVTWDRHPKSVVPGAPAPPQLTSVERKIQLLLAAGLDRVVVLSLDDELVSWEPERFLVRVFAEGLDARVIIVGSDWRFGRRAAGDVAMLRSLAPAFGFEVVSFDRRGASAHPASSTRVRAALARGAVDAARALLGRPFDVDARPTSPCDSTQGGKRHLQVAVRRDAALPPAGVYAGRVRAGGTWRECTITIEPQRRVRVEYRDGSGRQPRSDGLCLEFHASLEASGAALGLLEMTRRAPHAARRTPAPSR
jgi:riboflavin kinase / FMN adenylyltransferase